jgi:hypothetical protein
LARCLPRVHIHADARNVHATFARFSALFSAAARTFRDSKKFAAHRLEYFSHTLRVILH